MYEHVEKPKKIKSRSAANSVAQNKSNVKQGFRFVENLSKVVSQRIVIQRADSYAYGAANTTPHVHCYGPDSHVQIQYRGRVRRLNIVQNGQVHTQASDAQTAAQGNPTFLGVIQNLITAAGGTIATVAPPVTAVTAAPLSAYDDPSTSRESRALIEEGLNQGSYPPSRR